MKYLVFCVGTAGAGKSTFVKEMMHYFKTRYCHAINMDPAVEKLEYECSVDIRDLIRVDDVMEELELGPNGALIYCYEYLLENIDWIQEKFNFENDFLIVDCPGQIELYTHLNLMPRLVKIFEQMGYRQLVIHLTEAHHLTSPHHYWSIQLNALSSMMLMGLPHLNVLTKCDLLPNYMQYIEEIPETKDAFTQKLASVLLDHVDLRWIPIDYSNENTVEDLMILMDQCLGFGEYEEVMERE